MVVENKQRDIDSFRPAQLRVHGKRGHLNFVNKVFQTRYATELDWLRQRAARPERASRNTQIDIVMQPTSATNSLCFHFLNWAILLPFQMQTLGWNLFQMNFHWGNLLKFIT